MAKGNDGNFLQHSVEVAAASRLMVENPTGLHVALAHGMAPFEPFELEKAGSCRSRLKAALRLAGQPEREAEPQVVTAYRNAHASDEHYPNSAELLRTLRIGACPSRLLGGITETCPEKHKQLVEAWFGSPMRTANASWRQAVRPGGVLACPHDLRVPWLFAIGPMTYRKGGQCDAHNLSEHDIGLLSEAIAPYVESGQPGMAALFAYSVWPEQRQREFWAFINELARRTGMGMVCHWLTHRGGRRNLAALLHSSIDIPSSFIQDAVEEIEDVALVRAMQASPREFSTEEAVMDILEAAGGDAVSEQLRA